MEVVHSLQVDEQPGPDNAAAEARGGPPDAVVSWSSWQCRECQSFATTAFPIEAAAQRQIANSTAGCNPFLFY